MTDEYDEGLGNDDDAAYRVGYGRPPKESQFQPGRSGNPKGRPKGSKEQGIEVTKRDRLTKMILEIARRKIKVNDAGVEVEIETVEAILRSLTIKAMKGDVRAQSKFLHMVSTTEAAEARQREAGFQGAVMYKEEWTEKIKQRKKAGIDDVSDIVPHPDDIEINVWAGTADLVGPMTQEEKKDWDRYIRLKQQTEAGLPELEAEAAAEKDPNERTILLADIERSKRIISATTQILSLRRSFVTGEATMDMPSSSSKRSRAKRR